MARPDSKRHALAALALLALAGAAFAGDANPAATPAPAGVAPAPSAEPPVGAEPPAPATDEPGSRHDSEPIAAVWSPTPTKLPAPGPPVPAPPTSLGATYVVNLAALAANPFAPGNTFRVEVGVEQPLARSRLTSAVLLAAGRVEVPDYDAALALEVAGQFRYYALGNLARGLYVGGHMGFWRVGPRYAIAPGALAGVKVSGPGGATLDLQACAEWPVDAFSVGAGSRVVPLRTAWRALAPGLMLGVGFSGSKAAPPPRPRGEP